MARRRTRTKRRTRRTSRGFNIKQAAFALGSAQIASKAITGLGVWDFFTAGTALGARRQGGYLPGSTGENFNQLITLKEIMQGSQFGGAGQTPGGIGEVMLENIQANAVPAIMGFVGLKVADKLLTKAGVWRNTNKMLKAVGVKDIVRV
jgi:hypothetical protein